MLGCQAWPGPSLPDLHYPNGLAGHCREGDGRPHYLAAAFAAGAVYLDHGTENPFNLIPLHSISVRSSIFKGLLM
jgi:hypothetical protein